MGAIGPHNIHLKTVLIGFPIFVPTPTSIYSMFPINCEWLSPEKHVNYEQAIYARIHACGSFSREQALFVPPCSTWGATWQLWQSRRSRLSGQTPGAPACGTTPSRSLRHGRGADTTNRSAPGRPPGTSSCGRSCQGPWICRGFQFQLETSYTFHWRLMSQSQPSALCKTSQPTSSLFSLGWQPGSITTRGWCFSWPLTGLTWKAFRCEKFCDWVRLPLIIPLIS